MEEAHFPFLLLPNDRPVLPTHTHAHIREHTHTQLTDCTFDLLGDSLPTTTTANPKLVPTLTQVSSKCFGNVRPAYYVKINNINLVANGDVLWKDTAAGEGAVSLKQLRGDVDPLVLQRLAVVSEGQLVQVWQHN